MHSLAFSHMYLTRCKMPCDANDNAPAVMKDAFNRVSSGNLISSVMTYLREYTGFGIGMCLCEIEEDTGGSSLHTNDGAPTVSTSRNTLCVYFRENLVSPRGYSQFPVFQPASQSARQPCGPSPL